MPKPRRGTQSSKSLTLHELQGHFHLPINEVARKLGLCVTVLKQRCRENGIDRWPYRKVRKLDRLLTDLQGGEDDAPEPLSEDLVKKFHMIKQTRSYLLQNPNSTAHLKLGKVKTNRRLAAAGASASAQHAWEDKSGETVADPGSRTNGGAACRGSEVDAVPPRDLFSPGAQSRGHDASAHGGCPAGEAAGPMPISVSTATAMGGTPMGPLLRQMTPPTQWQMIACVPPQFLSTPPLVAQQASQPAAMVPPMPGQEAHGAGELAPLVDFKIQRAATVTVFGSDSSAFKPPSQRAAEAGELTQLALSPAGCSPMMRSGSAGTVLMRSGPLIPLAPQPSSTYLRAADMVPTFSHPGGAAFLVAPERRTQSSPSLNFMTAANAAYAQALSREGSGLLATESLSNLAAPAILQHATASTMSPWMLPPHGHPAQAWAPAAADSVPMPVPLASPAGAWYSGSQTFLASVPMIPQPPSAAAAATSSMESLLASTAPMASGPNSSDAALFSLERQATPTTPLFHGVPMMAPLAASAPLAVHVPVRMPLAKAASVEMRFMPGAPTSTHESTATVCA